MEDKLYFTSDYMEGAHPAILRALVETNLCKTVGYGMDPYCKSAADRIRKACACPEAQVWFLVGGTQTNATVIDACLRSWQGVVAAETGHISSHEAGAVEFGGHKVLTLPHALGKLRADRVESLLEQYYADANHEHMVEPGMVYISHPTEYGTLYTKEELEALRSVCTRFGIPLFLDGARLAYALACPENDVTLPDLCRLCDVFYIGGTKCGAFAGEAVVASSRELMPHFFSIMKQHGALLAKGRFLGIQFDCLFRDDLYLRIGSDAVRYAGMIRKALKERGYKLAFDAPTNQIFILLENSRMEALGKQVEFGFWEQADENHTVIRLATSWATSEEDVKRLIELL